jgi:two-component system cell cycle sensor histidine kinase/response regulator CckA
LPLAVAVLDEEGHILAGNDALVATVGPDARQGSDPAAMVMPEDADLLREAIRMVTHGDAIRHEVRVALLGRPDERQLVSIARVPPGLGVSALLALPDVREQLRLEAQVRAATHMQAVGQLAGGIAHDFNNILTAVLTLSDQIMERNPSGSTDHEAAAQIGINGRRAAALVAQLLAFARRQPQRAQLLDLKELLHGLAPLLQQLLGKGVRLRLSEQTLPATVRADPGQIEQVIVNLAVNARDAMHGKGDLDITLSLLSGKDVAALGYRIMPGIDHVVIEVRDSGAGIPPEIAGKIFEPFFTTKKLGEGTGLGLSTAYGIVKQSGGFIFNRPGPGGVGTVFSIYLPAVKSAAAQDVASLPAPPPTATVSLAGLHLLLVEDEPGIRQILTRGLRRHGVSVRPVADAELALLALESGEAFDVLLSDVMMPGLDGVELSRRARAAQPGLAVLLMSGFAEPPLHKAAETAGIGFIAKPFTLDELLVSLSEAVHAAGIK